MKLCSDVSKLHLLPNPIKHAGGFVGDSNQSWLDAAYAPPLGHALQHQGSNVSQQGLLANQGLVSGHEGLVNGPQGLVKGHGAVRHQRQADNPFVDERWPFTPMAAEPNYHNGGYAPYSNPNYAQSQFQNPAASAVGPLNRWGSQQSQQGSTGLTRYGSGDQYAHGTTFHHGLMTNQVGAGMMRQASSPSPGMPLKSYGMPLSLSGFGPNWMPATAAAGSSAAANSLVMHGPYSLLERPGPGELMSNTPLCLLGMLCMPCLLGQCGCMTSSRYCTQIFSSSSSSWHQLQSCRGLLLKASTVKQANPICYIWNTEHSLH